MALNTNTTLYNGADGYIASACDVKGTYYAVSSTSEIPAAVLKSGALCYCTNTAKYYRYNGNTWVETLSASPSPIIVLSGSLYSSTDFYLFYGPSSYSASFNILGHPSAPWYQLYTEEIYNGWPDGWSGPAFFGVSTYSTTLHIGAADVYIGASWHEGGQTGGSIYISARNSVNLSAFYSTNIYAGQSMTISAGARTTGDLSIYAYGSTIIDAYNEIIMSKSAKCSGMYYAGGIKLQATNYTNGSITLSASQSMSILAGSNIYIYGGQTMSNGGVYIAGSHTYISATNNVLNLSGISGITMRCASGSYVTIHRINLSSAPVVAAVEHCIKFYCSQRWNVRFSFLDRTSQAAFRTTTTSVTATGTPDPLTKLATCLYNNGYRSEYTALPVCTGSSATVGLANNGIPFGIYATSNKSTSIYFAFQFRAYSNSSANLVFGTTGDSSYYILYDNRRIIQGS